MQKPSLPKGTRDFSPEMMAKRNFIFDTIKTVFQKFGFQPIETPALENLSVLMGKYGEEGDQLLFKILNSGDFLGNIPTDNLSQGYKKFTLDIAEKGLKYDLTVPFARYVVMHRHEIVFPFKRYQIQPVWRGDRPQKGRYREFYQCDADVIGTDSLLCEAEIVLMIHEVFENLQLSDFTLKINNRKILSGIAETVGAAGKEADLAIAIDKLDKIGQENVAKELLERGFSEIQVQKLNPIFNISGSFEEKIMALTHVFQDSAIGKKGLAELQTMLDLLGGFGLESKHLEFDISLARGLSYYTGAIFEVKANHVSIGSITGGGRYDNLTGSFGLPGISGVGISFGVDRIYDVMEELALFPEQTFASTQIMLATFDEKTFRFALSVLKKLRENNIRAEIFAESAQIKKQLNYANARRIPMVAVIGETEIQTGEMTVKDMLTGTQELMTLENLINLLKSNS
ncbi:MAG: histidine--tRNA ligase [Verrucomicrobia bacterium]|nr:histidine--tRNA ligase [Cytophagales bacterium]